MTLTLAGAQVREAKARGRPYTVVFVGVNGVGKSTNLAKVAYWLLQNDVSARPSPTHLSCKVFAALRQGEAFTLRQCLVVSSSCWG